MQCIVVCTTKQCALQSSVHYRAVCTTEQSALQSSLHCTVHYRVCTVRPRTVYIIHVILESLHSTALQLCAVWIVKPLKDRPIGLPTRDCTWKGNPETDLVIEILKHNPLPKKQKKNNVKKLHILFSWPYLSKNSLNFYYVFLPHF